MDLRGTNDHNCFSFNHYKGKRVIEVVLLCLKNSFTLQKMPMFSVDL